ncbi:MAG: T9SS type A sorting domain-containing protein [Ignavibacteriaceae bacterium]|nr:T9SS type A sorting domain-containing protein [Ignavibacteriaceae bacterium]
MGYTLSVSNSSGAIVNSSASQLFLANYTPVNAGLFNSNNLYIPFSNDGIIADLDTGAGAGGKYDNSVFLFSSGFFLSGLAGINDWANGVMSASRIQDYSTGPVREYPGFNSIFIVKASDAPFSKSWQDWRYAVADGASFYDGNGDAIYNPVDLNNNSVWDTNEDRPDLIGDFTAWCVFNDGIPSGLRRFSNVDPMGIEIQQTIFGWSAPGTPLSNSMFVRYSLINKSGSYEKFDSVYFSFASDPDLGDYADDLVGSDSLLNLGYVYNSGPDDVFGNNCPAFGIAVLQGPPAYIPGKTFTDVNGNGIYDHGSDTPLDTAFNHKGKYLSRDAFPGAENLKMTSFQHYMSSHPTNGDPNTKTELRNYLLGGRDKFGQRINPCTWSFGSVYPPANCALVNPEYFYSGDPVTSTGWLNNTGVDQRMLVNTGPFTLVRNKKVDIIGAYSVGRHSTASLNSVNVLKDNITYIKEFYNDNFTRTGLPGANSNINGEGFSLGDNYPNPFNPVTVIGFSIPVASEVSLKIYDILGNEVADLVNSAKTAGYHNVQFNSTGLASGVYFYQLRAGSFSQIKKMIIVK